MSVLSTIQERWSDIIASMKDHYDLSDTSFRTWFIPMKVVRVDEDSHCVVISVPYEKPVLDFLRKNYRPSLCVEIEEASGYLIKDITFISEDSGEQNSEDRSFDSSSSERYRNTTLDEKFTFDSFVVGSNNNMAHAASLAVAENPGQIYNPLFIYGGSGLGKTHLMHAIGNFIVKHYPEKKVLYASCEKFMNEFILAVRNENNYSVDAFREKYRNIDALLLDDIQFMIGKERLTEEFFHTFNDMYTAKKAIVLTSDRSPREYKAADLEERLISRFEWGLTVDVQPPDYETRIAILRKKEEQAHYDIDNSVIQYIAQHVKSNIREMEGALTKVVAASNLLGQKITLELAEDILKDVMSTDESEQLTPRILMNVVCEHFRISEEDLMSSRRNKEIVMPRQITMYLCREVLNMKQETIGRLLHKDHSTVIYGIKKVHDDMANDEDMRITIEVLRKKLSVYNT